MQSSLKDEIIHEIRKEADMAMCLEESENAIPYDKLIDIINKFIPDFVINLISDKNNN